MVRSYEELIGALGRAVFFRPVRRRTREWLSADADPVLLVEGAQYPVFDLSMNGVSLLAPEPTEAWAPGRDLSGVLVLHGERMFEGRMRVARVEPRGSGSRVGLALVGGFLDLPEVRRRDEDARIARELAGGAAAQRAGVPATYREAVERAVHFAQYYRAALGRQERRYREEGADVERRVAELAARAADALRAPWTEIREAASDAALACLADPETLRASKAYTEAVLTPLLLDAPMIRRSYTKPLGYPGDYQVMLYYYDNALHGETAFGRVFHKYFVEHPLSNGVRTRKDHVVAALRAEHLRATAGLGAPVFRVASLGCGPAREVADYVRQAGAWRGTVVFTLIDQEDETLSVAHRDAAEALARTGAHGEVQCLNLSFAQLLADPELLPERSPQDVIYSTGLFDYLREARARTLLAALYHRLAPGGTLLIGNALGPNRHFWSPEFVLDWTLLYRSRDEMFRLAASLPSDARVDVEVEPGNAYWFLTVRRPGGAAPDEADR